MKHLRITGLAVLGIASAADAQTLTGIGLLPPGSISVGTLHSPASNCHGLSADGLVAVGVGSWSPYIRPFRWTRAGGMSPMNFMPGVTNGTAAYATNGDGTVVVGTGISGPISNRAIRWVGDAPQDLGTLAGGAQSYGEDVSDDGSRVCGMSESSAGLRAFLWTAADGMLNLGTLPGKSFSRATAISGDGQVVIGYAFNTSTDARGFRWTSAGGIQDMGDVSPGSPFVPSACSEDGSTIVGGAIVGSVGHGWKWTAAGGLTDLGIIAGANNSGANNVNADGRVVVGSSGGASIWTATGGWMKLKRILELEEIPNSDWNLGGAFDISADGLTIAGSGSHTLPSGSQRQEGWVIRLAVLPCNLADIAKLGGAPGPDGRVTPDDLIAFIEGFFAGSLVKCDLIGLGGFPVPDGQLTADDIVEFLRLFFLPC
ncbi:MAG: GC-type dockerin domain-anchored protein [Phycisphaerales bacterium]